MPETLEEKIVCHADNLVKGRGGVQTLDQATEEMMHRGYSTTAERMRKMHAELSQACGENIDDVVRRMRSSGEVKASCAAYIGRLDGRL
jgi:site-specific recombinase